MKKYLIGLISIATLSLTFFSCAGNETPAIGTVTGVTLSQTSAALLIGDTLQLSATVWPNDALNQNVSWTSSHSSIATVDATGFVTAVSTVTRTSIATITVITEDGDRRATCAVTVFPPYRCRLETPGWGEHLGAVSFYTDYEWTIEGNGITQIWSDAVTAAACQDTAFSGGTMGDYIADCRSNPGFPGDLFSWCAVMRFADVLCPAPWRVPTQQDFIDLDMALGGTGTNRLATSQYVYDNFVTRWGGHFSGGSRANGSLWAPDSWGYYWSQTEQASSNGFLLSFDVLGSVRPQNGLSKGSGLSLRCVR